MSTTVSSVSIGLNRTCLLVYEEGVLVKAVELWWVKEVMTSEMFDETSVLWTNIKIYTLDG